MATGEMAYGVDLLRNEVEHLVQGELQRPTVPGGERWCEGLRRLSVPGRASQREVRTAQKLAHSVEFGRLCLGTVEEVLHVLRQELDSLVPRAAGNAPEASIRVRLLGEETDPRPDVLPEHCVLEPTLRVLFVLRDVGDVLVGVDDPDLDDSGRRSQRPTAVVQSSQEVTHRSPRVWRLVESGRPIELVQEPRFAEVEAVAGIRHSIPKLDAGVEPCSSGCTRDPVRPTGHTAERDLRDRVDASPMSTYDVVLEDTESLLVRCKGRNRDVVVGTRRQICGEGVRKHRPVA